MSADRPRDLRALRETTGDEFARELVDTFLAEAPSMLDDLRQSLARAGRRALPPRRALAQVEQQHVRRADAWRSLARELELGGIAAGGRGAALDHARSRIRARGGRVEAATP